MRAEYFKDHYEFEWQHRAYLSNAVNLPLAVGTLLGSAAAVMGQKFPYQNDYWTFAFLGLIVSSVLCMAYAAFCLWRSFVGYKYKRTPTPLVLKSYYDELLQWHQSHKNGEVSADQRFEDYFNERLAQAAEVNADNNKKKSGYLYQCNATLGIAAFLLALSVAPYLVQSNRQGETTYTVRIVKDERMEESSVPDDPETPEPPEEAQPTPPEPTMPPNEDIREHEIRPEVISETLRERR